MDKKARENSDKKTRENSKNIIGLEVTVHGTFQNAVVSQSALGKAACNKQNSKAIITHVISKKDQNSLVIVHSLQN